MSYLLYNTKHLLKPVITVSLFIIILFFVSCSDDAVTPPPPNNNYIQIIDSNIIDWQFEILYNYQIYDIYVIDSNNIFLAGNPSSLYYHDTIFAPICPVALDFFPTCISGVNENFVLIGGNDYSFPISNSKLKKWNGNSIEEIPMPSNDSTCGIDNIYIESENDIWITTRSNKIYHYLNANITVYTIPILNIFPGTKLYKYFDEKLYMLGDYQSDNNWFCFVLKYENNEWIILTIDAEISFCSFAQCGLDILRTGKNDTYLFNGKSWNNIVEIPEFETQIICGASKNNFLVFGNFTRYGPFPVFYNGEKLLKQTDFQVPYPIMSIENVFTYKDNKFYGFIAGDPYNNALIKGKFKNQ